MRRLSSFPPLGVARLSKWKSGKDSSGQDPTGAMDNDLCFFKPSWKQFSTLELQKATDDFNQENLIGKGGFSEVYEGCLESGQFVAVKRLTKGSIEERTNNFLAELGILVHVNHHNIAKLIGVGVEGDLHIVLRLSPNGSLSSHLYGSKGRLEWDMRYKIALGTAEAVEYLHERCARRIIHRDIKASNILLTEDFEPQLCDFGLAKWLPDELTHHTVSSFEGTFGYLAPEYLTHGVVDEKTDVFAFGVLLLELISGRKALDSAQHSLLMWARPLLEKGDVNALVDPMIGYCYDPRQLEQVTEAASLCIQHSSVLRPRMSEVLTMLKGKKGMSESPKLHQIPLRRRTYSEELFDAEEYNATKYLNDLSRHKQIALDFRAGGDVADKEPEEGG